MKVSIVVPIYNSEKYLSRCIDSILNQTYLNIEVILVNDGSRDGSLKVCNEYLLIDDRIKLINQENKGLAGARNTGIKSATGEYVCFIDSDDEIELNMIEEYYNIIKKHNPSVIISNLLQWSKGNKNYNTLKGGVQYEKLLTKIEIIENFIRPYYGFKMGFIPSVCNKCYQLNFLKSNNLWFDESLRRSEDYWFNFYFFQKANSVYSIDKAFYHYYANDGSMIRSFREGQFDDFLNNRKKLIDEYKNFDFLINWQGLDNDFISNINELVLLEIKIKGFLKAKKNIKYYLSNSEFKEIYSNSILFKPHTRLIQYFFKNNMISIVLLIFYVWSFKVK